MKDLPALLRTPKARSGMLIVLLIGLAHFCAYSYLAPSLKMLLVLMGQPLVHYYCSMELLVFSEMLLPDIVAI